MNRSQELFELPITMVPSASLVISLLPALHLSGNTLETSADLTSLIFT